MLIKNSDQNVTAWGSFTCDYCQSEANSNSAGYADIAQGATGRWCEVMWSCNNCGEDRELNGSPCYDVNVARDMVTYTLDDGRKSWPDF